MAPKPLQEHMGLERHALYYHLKILEDCGLVTKKQKENGASANRHDWTAQAHGTHRYGFG
ncbi:MAG: helix-turn-helix transcriptional regulator [Planctomycetes bacterium]|nr:helix-turn-helix transcriptional regulator [Planctomycetota bacterium]